MHRLATLSVSFLLCLSVASSTAADPRYTTAATLQQVLAMAKSGDTITLAADEFRDVNISGRRFKPAIVIDAKEAKLFNWVLKDVAGIAIRGAHFSLNPPTLSTRTGLPAWGTSIFIQHADDIEISDSAFQGPGQADAKTSGVFGDGYGFKVDSGSQVTVARNTFAGYKIGLLVSNIDGFKVLNNTFTSMRSDGMDIAMAHNGLVEGNACSGTVVRDKEHPDCIQMWSRPGGPATSDIVIRKNKVEGDSQGISLFNHVRDGVDDGGFDRILIEDNDVEVRASQGIAIVQGRNSVVRNNRVKTLSGAVYRASINTSKSADVVRCGNVVEPGAGKPGVIDPKC